MSMDRKARQTGNKIETEIVEDNRVLSAYGYCQLPTHFFDRALAQMNQLGRSGLTVAKWGERRSSARNQRDSH